MNKLLKKKPDDTKKTNIVKKILKALMMGILIYFIFWPGSLGVGLLFIFISEYASAKVIAWMIVIYSIPFFYASIVSFVKD